MRSDLVSTAEAGRIPLSVPHLCGNEARYLAECIETGWVSSGGPFVERFENQVAEFVNTRFGVATSSGTAALHLALRAAGVQADDEVLVSSLTFIAPANAVRNMGAWPVLMDSDPLHWQMDVGKVRDFLQRECQLHQGQLRNRQSGRRVRAVMPVHILGHVRCWCGLLDAARSRDPARPRRCGHAGSTCRSGGAALALMDRKSGLKR